jgi:hypothetical protein
MLSLVYPCTSTLKERNTNLNIMLAQTLRVNSQVLPNVLDIMEWPRILAVPIAAAGPYYQKVASIPAQTHGNCSQGEIIIGRTRVALK